MTLRMYADRKQWPLRRVAVRLTHAKIHAADCAECETKEGKLDRFERLTNLVAALLATGRPLRRPTAEHPLAGLTVLVVEDSRYACEAMRLLCQHSGARLRRADSLAAAARHLRVYRPDVLIVDLGLPDGPGEALIARDGDRLLRLKGILDVEGYDQPVAVHAIDLAACPEPLLLTPPRASAMRRISTRKPAVPLPPAVEFIPMLSFRTARQFPGAFSLTNTASLPTSRRNTSPIIPT